MSDQTRPPSGIHDDPGLQPERTTLAWGRTALALTTASAVFLLWLPHHGVSVVLLVLVAVGTAAAIYLTQRRRYRVSSHGISREAASADIPAVLCTTFAIGVLGLVGIGIVLAL